MSRRNTKINVLIIKYIIVRISSVKAINKDLIHQCTLCPFRRMKASHNTKGTFNNQLLIDASLCIIKCLSRRMNFKIIAKKLLWHNKLSLIEHKVIILAHLLHAVVFPTLYVHKFYNLCVFSCYTQSYPHSFSGLWFCWKNIIFCFI